ncbi:MAG: hypothetical protein H6817_06365 [Phycisphaerales bacterium]|nr:hypothetical protein [Phycisphaerales bacterium]
MAEAPDSPVESQPFSPGERRHKTIRRSRRVQAFGGFVLACCFFLPAITSCSATLYPCKEMVGMFPGSASEYLDLFTSLSNFVDFFLGCSVYTAAYVFGLLIALSVLSNRSPESRLARYAASTSTLLICAVALSTLLFDFIGRMSSRNLTTWDVSEIVALSIAALTLVYVPFVSRRCPAGVICRRCWIALCCIVWFASWTLDGALIGVHLALAGSLLILVGAIMEAKTRCRRRFPHTLWAIATGTLADYEPDAEVCERCGYLLIGLTEPRCPECGTPYDMAAISSTSATHMGQAPDSQ